MLAQEFGDKSIHDSPSFCSALRGKERKLILIMDEITSLSKEDSIPFFGALKYISTDKGNYGLYSYSSIGTLAALEQPIAVE